MLSASMILGTAVERSILFESQLHHDILREMSGAVLLAITRPRAPKNAGELPVTLQQHHVALLGAFHLVGRYLQGSPGDGRGITEPQSRSI